MHVVCAGAAGGIGRRVTTQLLAAGHSVVALDRDAAGLTTLRESVEDTDADGLETAAVDLTDASSAAAAVEDVAADAVVSCVGWYALGALEDCSPERFRDHLDSNLLAVHAVVHPLLATLRERSGRVVIVGSMAGSVPLPFHGGYGAAKAGLAAYATTLRRELREHDVDVVLVEPGPIRTGLNERAAAALATDGAADAGETAPYADAYRAFESYAPESTSPEVVASRVANATTTSRPRARYRVGARARLLPWLGAALPTALFDRIVRAGMPDGPLGRWIDRRQ